MLAGTCEQQKSHLSLKTCMKRENKMLNTNNAEDGKLVAKLQLFCWTYSHPKQCWMVNLNHNVIEEVRKTFTNVLFGKSKPAKLQFSEVFAAQHQINQTWNPDYRAEMSLWDLPFWQGQLCCAHMNRIMPTATRSTGETATNAVFCKPFVNYLNSFRESSILLTPNHKQTLSVGGTEALQ